MGYYNSSNEWVNDEPLTAHLPEPVPQQPTKVEMQIEPTEPTIEEHASMIRKGFDSILNKALESTELAQRVAELERMLAEEHAIVQGMREDLAVSRIANDELRKTLQEVQSTLAQRDTAVHDLVIERDIVIGERNAAQKERDEAKDDATMEEANARMWERKAIDLDHAVQVATERAEQMAQQVTLIKQAFKGLMAL
jgi:hypothetical protein